MAGRRLWVLEVKIMLVEQQGSFEYGGFWEHFTDRVSGEWRWKVSEGLDTLLVPPVAEFHRFLVIMRHVGKEGIFV